MISRIVTAVIALLGLAFHMQAIAAPPMPEINGMDVSSRGGVRWEFKPEGGEWKSIEVPAGGWRAQGYTCDAGVYRTVLTMPHSVHGRVVHLAFAAVNFGADVFAGPDDAHLTRIASHVDGWLPFSADLTPWANPGAHVLVQVEVKGRRKFMVNGKYTVPEGATWFPGLAEGILRGVMLQVLPPVRVDDIFVKTQVGPDTLQSQITLVNDSDLPAKAKLIPHLSSVNSGVFRYPKMPILMVNLPPKSSRMVDIGAITWPAGPESYWWPNVPYRPGYRARLHILEVSLQVNGKTVQPYRQRFGFRQFVVHGNHYEWSYRRTAAGERSCRADLASYRPARRLLPPYQQGDRQAAGCLCQQPGNRGPPRPMGGERRRQPTVGIQAGEQALILCKFSGLALTSMSWPLEPPFSIPKSRRTRKETRS